MPQARCDYVDASGDCRGRKGGRGGGDDLALAEGEGGVRVLQARETCSVLLPSCLSQPFLYTAV